MRRSKSPYLLALMALGYTALWANQARAITFLETDAELLASAFPPKVVAKLSGRQINELKVALELMTMPAIPDELARILTIADQLTRTDPVAQGHLEAVIAENARWVGMGRTSPADLQQFISLMYQKNALPVIAQVTLIEGKTHSIDALLEQSNTVSRSPFGIEALRVRAVFIDLVKEERLKADANAPGAPDILLVLSAPSADAATARLNQSASGTTKPSCESVTWLPAFDSEPGARYTAKDGWEKPEVPCQ